MSRQDTAAAADVPARVAVIGTGVIGNGWSVRALAAGCDVVAFDPAPGAEATTNRVRPPHNRKVRMAVEPNRAVNRVRAPASSTPVVKLPAAASRRA